MISKALILLLLSFTIFGQSIPVRIATLSSSVGSSRYIQSIGQSSVVIGTKAAGAYMMRQGFLQPSSSSMVRSIENKSSITIELYPNPFSSQFRLKLSHSSTSPSQVEIYSIDGLLVWSGEIISNLSEVQLLNFERLHAGKYILRLFTNNQVITKQLIKE